MAVLGFLVPKPQYDYEAHSLVGGGGSEVILTTWVFQCALKSRYMDPSHFGIIKMRLQQLGISLHHLEAFNGHRKEKSFLQYTGSQSGLHRAHTLGFHQPLVYFLQFNIY